MMRVAGAALALGVAAPAWANSGIGYLFPSVPALIVALVPVIFVEAPVLAAILRLRLDAGLMLSVVVNLRSTLLGIVIAIATDLGLSALSGGSMGPPPSRAGVLFSLVPMFFITLWIERRAVVRKYPQLTPARSANATIAANVLSYAALVAAILYVPFFKVYDEMGYRERVYGAATAANSWRDGVEAYWQKHKRFPERAGDLGVQQVQRRGVRTVTLEPATGRVVVELSFPSEPELDRRQLIYEPRVVGDKLEWKCRAPDVRPRYAPHSCRD